MEKNRIEAILFDLKVEDHQVLFLVLDSKGSITRKGIGNYSNDALDEEMFIGTTKENIFGSVIARLDGEMLKHMGSGYKVGEPRGKTCQLQILLKSLDNEETGILFVYGTESD